MRVEIALVQRRLGRVDAIQIAHQPLHAAMGRVVEQLPIGLPVVVPLALLPELAAHEQELLAGMRPHEPEIGAQIGETLPVICPGIRPTSECFPYTTSRHATAAATG